MAFHHKTGFVLSGGGMRGMAHIGVIQAMREFNIEADYVAGTSIGAVIGAMYAADIPTKEILDFFREISIFSFRNYSFNKPGLIDSERFRNSLLQIFPADSFDILPRKLSVSVTNLLNGRNRLVESGSLTTALLCSAAIPGVFSPVKVGATLYCDGGLTNNYPVEILHSRCQFIVGSYVNPLIQLSEDTKFKNTFSLFDRALVIATYRMESPSFNLADVFIMPEKLERTPTLSLKHIDASYKIGYEDAVERLTEYFENNQYHR